MKSSAKTGAATRSPQSWPVSESRLVKLRAAKEAIEAEAAQKAADKAAGKAAKKGADDAGIAEAAATAAAGATPADRAQRSFTDPESRMMKTVDGFHYAYNAQTVVDEHSQVIVAANVTDHPGDVAQLIPMIAAAADSLTDAGIEASPKVFLADAGYCSQDNLQEIRRRGDQRFGGDGADQTQRTGTRHAERADPERRYAA